MALTTNVYVSFGDATDARALSGTAVIGPLARGTSYTHLVLPTKLALCDFCHQSREITCELNVCRFQTVPLLTQPFAEGHTVHAVPTTNLSKTLQ